MWAVAIMVLPLKEFGDAVSPRLKRTWSPPFGMVCHATYALKPFGETAPARDILPYPGELGVGQRSGHPWVVVGHYLSCPGPLGVHPTQVPPSLLVAMEPEPTGVLPWPTQYGWRVSVQAQAESCVDPCTLKGVT